MFEVVKIDKSYGRNHALDHFSYTFDTGIYALLGPNGSGKSTLMNILTGNLRADSGNVLFNGKEMRSLGREYFRSLGFMPQYTGMYPRFTVSEMLYYIAELKGVSKKLADEQIFHLLSTVELIDVAKRKIKALSGGMRQRLALIQALLGNPQLVLLDEPTAGLDPRQRIIVRNLITEEAMERTVIIATHVVSDIEATAREAIFLKKGVLLAHGMPTDIAETVRGKVYTILCDDVHLPELQERYQVLNFVKTEEGAWRVRLLSDNAAQGLESVEPSLEDAYLYMFGAQER